MRTVLIVSLFFLLIVLFSVRQRRMWLAISQACIDHLIIPPNQRGNGGNHEGPLTLSSKVGTSLPMYYVNLDRSKDRREHMERVFGSWGSLTRVAAVDASNFAAMDDAVDLHNLTPEKYAEDLDGKKGEVALTASHMKCVQQALAKGDDVMLLFEDDVNEILSPFWTLSLEEVVQMADDNYPGWEIIQLQSNFKDPKSYDAWKYEPNAPLLRQTKERVSWGCAAQLINKKGMKKLVKLFVRNGKADCYPVIKKNPGLKCIPDDFYWKLAEIESYVMVPPMFGQMMNEGSTGVRLKTKKNLAGNDHYPLHFRSYHLSLRSNVEAFENYNARWELGEGVQMPYMKDY